MKKILLILLVSLVSMGIKAQDTIGWYPCLFTKEYVVVAINSHTTDQELLRIRKDILKYSSIRFTNFDVIRTEKGDIRFLSMAVDCRDGYKGSISHSFEPGDTTYYGFVRDFSLNTYKKPFYIGNLLSPYSGINHVEAYLKQKKEEPKNIDFTKSEDSLEEE